MKRSRLGQNFLYDRSILEKIVRTAGVTGDDTVVEIGPGPGTLTTVLSKRAKRVIAIELDERLYYRLKAELSGLVNVELVHGDVLKFPFEGIGNFRVVANIPYYITTPIIFRLLDSRKHLSTMTLTVQKEVAERIVAHPGGKDYGVLSIMVQYLAHAELKFVIPREAFRPVPKVDSALLHMKILPEPSLVVRDERTFYRVVKTAFSQRRKTLSNSLKGLGEGIRDKLVACGIDPGRRPETLSMEEFGKLADLLAKEE
ncbi:MAG: 16S rRNA (adenine(1518)-N(6)/adenine(1519)-N(6))-dimethyltransferase RsmA [Candidatus Sulfobium sp.]|jgi:16S rRNA (adenine1518-N6/adenine1519-N6)-dimethyltransferase